MKKGGNTVSVTKILQHFAFVLILIHDSSVLLHACVLYYAGQVDH